MSEGQVSSSRKHAVILSGGGAHGAYEIGVMKALFGGYVDLAGDSREVLKQDPFKIFTGTSVGSFNAAFMASRPNQSSAQTAGELEKIWRQRISGTKTQGNGVFRIRGNPLELVDLNRMMASPMKVPANLLSDSAFFAKDFLTRSETFFRSKEELSKRFMGLLDFGVLISTEPLRSLVTEEIDLEKVRSNTDRTLVVAATNWEKGETELFSNRAGDASRPHRPLDDKIGHLAILASTAIPGIFPAVEIYHTKYVDGGLLMNTPLSPAIRAGAEVVHVIYLDPDLKDVPLDSSPSTVDMLNRMVSLSFANQVNRDIKDARIINQLAEMSAAIDAALQEMNLSEEASQRIGKIAGGHKNAYRAGPTRALTIHRYRPRHMLEGGLFGMLDFDLQRVSEMIDLGFNDAVTHDCSVSKCIFPTLGDLRAAQAAVAKG